MTTMIETIAKCITNHLSQFGINVRLNKNIITVNTNNEYKITVKSFEFDSSIEKIPNKLPYHRPCIKINANSNHADILDACLDSLSNNNNIQPLISDISTDGDYNDCEAIFFVENFGHIMIAVTPQ